MSDVDSESQRIRMQQATFEERVTTKLDEICDWKDRMEEKVDAIRTDTLPTLKTDIALLKFQAGLWGAALGAITAGIVAFFKK